MPPAEPAPDFNARLLARSPQRLEDSQEPNVYAQWKAIADELKLAGYPMNLGASVGVDHFTPDIRKKARSLDQYIEDLIGPLVEQPRVEATVDEAILSLRRAIYQGLTKEKFQKLMSDHNFSLKCSVIWESDAIAYRCNTCSLTPCMSLCATCFKGGDHEGHDVTRFFSREGGACDCGNEDVLKEAGFCSKHGENAERPPPPPVTIVSLAELILLRVLMLVLDHFRHHKQHHIFENVPQYMMKQSERADQVCGSGKLIALLQECVDYGGPIRDAVTRILIDQGIYSSIWAVPSENILDNVSTPSFREFREKHKFFEQMSRECLAHVMLQKYFPDFPKEAMKNTCFLHELLFWMRMHIFPQSLINLTLVFLGDTQYRDEFARRFFLLYPWTSDSMCDACNHENVDYHAVSIASSRIIHISVQMLSSAALCSRLTDEINLPKLMFGSVAFLLLSSEMKVVNIKPLRKEYQPPRRVQSPFTEGAVYEPNLRPLIRREDEIDFRVLQQDEQIEEEEVDDEVEVEMMMDDEVMIEEAEEAVQEGIDAAREGGEAVEAVRGEAADAGEEREPLIPPLDVPPHNDLPLPQMAPRQMRFIRTREESGMHDPSLDDVGLWYTLDVERSKVLTNHGYWFAMGDTQNLLSHPEVVAKMCRDESTMKLYFQVIEKMHCMDTIVRISAGDHLLNERPDDYQRTLVLEYEMSASSMFNLVYGIIARGDERAAAEFYDACWESLKRWFHHMDLPHAGKPLQLGKSTVTFHLPLSRHLSTLLAHASNLASIKHRLDSLVNNENKEILHALMLHPLRIQAARSEWAAGMWVRNGQQIRIPAFLYAQTHMLFSYYMPDLDLLRLCAANMESVDALHALFDAYSLGDVFKFKLTEGGRSGVDFKPLMSLSLKRIEWVDTLVFGCLRLIAEMVLLPGVDEQSHEEAMRDDIVCKLAIAPCPHSRLRQSMAEKGSHGAELVDQHFEKVLAGVAVFSDPEKDDSLDQGVYSLSKEAQIDLFCPLILMGRSTSLRHASTAMQNLELIERRMAGRPEHQVRNVWIPYRLLDFSKSMEARSSFNMGVYQVIVNDRLLETFCYILEMYKKDSDELEIRLSGAATSQAPHEFLFKEQTLQIVIYLLSNALLYMKTQPEEDLLRARFHKDLSDEKSPQRTLATSILSIGSVLMTLNMKRGEISKEEEEMNVRQMMREAVKAEIKARIVAGTPEEYYGRLLAILYRDDAQFREMLNEKYPEIAVEKMEEEEQPKSKENTPNVLIAKKRAAAEALRKRIMEDKKRKGGEMMKKLMQQENMTQEDLDRLDVSDKMVEQYECPICGDETPASFDQPIGLLVYVQFNGSYLNSVDANLEDKSLLDLDEEMEKDEDASNVRYRKHARYWRGKNEEMEHSIGGSHSDMIATPSMVELKTCGHHAHISCFSQYRETVLGYQVRQREHHSETLNCPKCRFYTNGLLPLRVRTGVEMNIGETMRNASSGGRLIVYDTLINQLNQARKAAVDLEEREAESPSTVYSLSTIKYLVENNSLSLHGIDKETFLAQRKHVILQGLLNQNIDRNLIFDCMGVTPVRPKCIDLVSEHLNFHSALSFTHEELDITMGHVRELLMDEPQELYEEPMIKTHSDPMEGPSGIARGDPYTFEEEIEDEGEKKKSLFLRSMNTLSNEDWNILSSSKKKTEDPDLNADMQCALTSPAVSKTDRWNLFHRGLETGDRNAITKLTRVRIRFSPEWKKRCDGKPAAKFDPRFPVLFSQPFALATRFTSITMSSELTRESMLESLHIVCRRLIVLAAVRWTVLQSCRVDYGRLREWAEEGTETDGRDIQTRPKFLVGIRRVIARVFCSHGLISSMAKSLQREELPSFEQSVMEPLKELMMRITQLWHEVRLVSLPEGVRSALGMTREQLERHVLGPAGIGALPTEFVLAQWTLNSVHALSYVLQSKQLLKDEPCSFRPFLSLRLPENYEDIFQRYFGRSCRRCSKVPQNPMICLICSEMICLDACCASNGANGERFLEPEAHACGVHMPFLALNSALIVLVKLHVPGLTTSCRVQIWGSVYLDAHGEEDRNLRRGKPLKLAQKRVDRLYRDFLEGDVESRVGYHKITNLAAVLRDAHIMYYR